MMELQINAFEQVVNDQYAIYHADSCEAIRAIAGDSVHFGIHSPPFAGLYRFSDSDRDISNNDTDDSFFNHYGFLISELLRITKPGRLHAVHVMQLPTSKARDGFIGMRDFRGETVRAFTDRGWLMHSEICIWKDPVNAQQRTKSVRLLHKQIKKDSCLSGQALADYILVFRKPGENDTPVDGRFEEWIGADARPENERDGWNDARTHYGIDVSRKAYDRQIANHTGEREPWSFDDWVSIMTWQRYASPVWMDINQNRTLQFRGARDANDEQHISPLQLDVIERCIDLWSNPGEIVFTPFLGIGSEVWGAVNMGRKGLGIELKASYFKQACKNLDELVSKEEEIFG
jgi:DNA modification methylase